MSPRLDIGHDERHEARDEPRRHGPGVRAGLLALAVAALVGGSWWAGHRSSPGTQEGGAVPEIHADNAPVKESPKDPGGMVVPDQDSVLLNRDAKGKPDTKAKPEELLPPPEAVKPRPTPPVPPPQAATANPPPAASTPLPNHASPETAAPQVATAPSASDASPTQAAPKSSVSVPAVPKEAPPSPPIAAGSYRLQLGALKTEEAAKNEWLKLQKQNSDVLGKLSLSVSRVELGAKGTYYRIQAGPVADEAKATQACAALKSRSVGCILVKP
ncbi:MAG TPA: SPOR domain-containing protein [Stellaceae bacterium]|jgi:cell division septation protein DedD